MQNDARVLSQLLWDLDSDKKHQLETIYSFHHSLTTPPISSEIKNMIDLLNPPLSLIIESKENWVDDYLLFCCKTPILWPYTTFLVALIEIMENSDRFAESWQHLSASQIHEKNVLLNRERLNIERLYSENIVPELRPIVDDNKKIVHEYYNMRWARESPINRDHYFINLKGMSSSSPIIYNNTFGTRFRGGGFYFRWNNYGVVVDPGLSFVSSMHEYGLSIYDINAIIITHDHLDHTGDMLLLEDLEYQIRKSNTIQWYVCSELVSRINSTQIIAVEYGKEYSLSPSIRFRATETRHIIDKTNPCTYIPTTFGCMFNLFSYKSSGDKMIPERTLGYTSDTTYWCGMEKYYNKSDILIANISSVRKADIIMQEQNKVHLGFNGCIRMLLNLAQAPQIFLLSEFWNGIEDIRFPVTKQLARNIARKKINTAIMPAEMGMEIDLAQLRVKCSLCGSYAHKIHLIKPKAEQGNICYACENCVFIPIS